MIDEKFFLINLNQLLIGWTFDCFTEWKLYLKLGLPGMATLLIEMTNFEIGFEASFFAEKLKFFIISFF